MLSGPFTTGLEASVDFLAQALLEDRHLGQLHELLSSRWHTYHSAHAAVKLLEQHGAELTPEEEQHLISTLGEAELIDALLAKIPSQSNAQSQTFNIHLQMIVSAAHRIRQGLEDFQPEEIAAALTDVDRTAIAPLVLKMAVVQAGSEVKNLLQNQKAWSKDAEQKMSRLVTGQGEALQAKRRLALAESRLRGRGSAFKQTAKKAIARLLSGAENAFLSQLLATWLTIARQARRENAVTEEYSGRIEQMEEQLMASRANQLLSVRAVMQRRALGLDSALVREVFDFFRTQVSDRKAEEVLSQEVRKVQAKLKTFKTSHAANVKQIMMRVGAACDAGLLMTSIKAWESSLSESKRQFELRGKVEAVETALKKRREAQNDAAKKIIIHLSRASDVGLSHMVVKSWAKYGKGATQDSGMADLLNAQLGRLSDFGIRNARTAFSTLNKAGKQLDLFLLQRTFSAWQLDNKLGKLLRRHQALMESKKEQLRSVNGMFRSFAHELEGTTSKSPSGAKSSVRRMLSKTEGSVLLPNIHAKQLGSDRQGLAKTQKTHASAGPPAGDLPSWLSEMWPKASDDSSTMASSSSPAGTCSLPHRPAGTVTSAYPAEDERLFAPQPRALAPPPLALPQERGTSGLAPLRQVPAWQS
ncbi:unnamed protein product [Polarella glacialis]|uniref:Uncharacterized protein n=1 Tax=Polarella glacialis TaxID=89957 RepID=A0A813E5S9_POLGL|nr:unnamed protein product [Polarella glacialis]